MTYRTAKHDSCVRSVRMEARAIDFYGNIVKSNNYDEGIRLGRVGFSLVIDRQAGRVGVVPRRFYGIGSINYSATERSDR